MLKHLLFAVCLAVWMGPAPARAGEEKAGEKPAAEKKAGEKPAAEKKGAGKNALEKKGAEEGKPEKPAQTEKKVVKGVTFYERLKKGGVIVLVLILISVALLAVTLERLALLRRGRHMPAGLAERSRKLWAEGKYAEIRKACEAVPSTLSAIIASLASHRSSSSIEVSNMAGDIASQDMRAQMQKTIPFQLIATISPLLGLLGTVSGMIDSFEMVAIAGKLGDASLLADGISKALVTTAAGLLVAVPAIALFNFFKARTGSLALALETEVNLLISEWFMSGAEEEG